MSWNSGLLCTPPLWWCWWRWRGSTLTGFSCARILHLLHQGLLMWMWPPSSDQIWRGADIKYSIRSTNIGPTTLALVATIVRNTDKSVTEGLLATGDCWMTTTWEALTALTEPCDNIHWLPLTQAKDLMGATRFWLVQRHLHSFWPQWLRPKCFLSQVCKSHVEYLPANVSNLTALPARHGRCTWNGLLGLYQVLEADLFL